MEISYGNQAVLTVLQQDSQERGLQFSHDIIRQWEKRFAPLIIDTLRKKRRGNCGSSWYIDEIYVKVSGKWCYLYRAIDKEGHLVDFD